MQQKNWRLLKHGAEKGAMGARLEPKECGLGPLKTQSHNQCEKRCEKEAVLGRKERRKEAQWR